MKASSIIGIVLIIVGVLVLTFRGIPFVTKEKVVEVGPLQVTKETQRTMPLPPILGALALAGGVVLVILGAKKA